MDKIYSMNFNGWSFDLLKQSGNGHLIATILDSEEKLMQQKSLSKSQVRKLIAYLESVEKEIVE